MPQVIDPILIGHDLSLVLIQHHELAITDFANFPVDLLSILEFNTFWKRAGSQSAVRTIYHGTELALQSLLEGCLAGETSRLITLEFITGCIVLHLQLKDHLIRIKGMIDPEDADCHDLFHFRALVPDKSFVRLLYFHQRLIGKTLPLDVGVCARSCLE